MIVIFISRGTENDALLEEASGGQEVLGNSKVVGERLLQRHRYSQSLAKSDGETSILGLQKNY